VVVVVVVVVVVPNAIRYSKVEEICCGMFQVSVTAGFASEGAVKAGAVGFEPGVFQLRVA
jgi:hypothetical protein